MCAGWLSRPLTLTWPMDTLHEVRAHEAVMLPTVYVQPVCPSYTVVGPSSITDLCLPAKPSPTSRTSHEGIYAEGTLLEPGLISCS